ncbi:MAG: hypothetical protein RIN56_11230 [Sporomusaceae bacterium]|nr:hypothetical protein [Sporomusaceae bacterium]
MNSLERLFGRFFADWLPGLPAGVRDWAAKILPWVVIVLGVLGLLAWLSVIGLFGAATLKTAGFSRAFPSFAAAVFHILVPILQALAIAGGCFMLKRRRLGWVLAFYALLLGILMNLVWFNPAGLIWDFVFAYLLFQLKPYYREG